MSAGPRRKGAFRNYPPYGDKSGRICQIGGKYCKFQRLASAIPDYLIGEFKVSSTAADSSRG